LVRCARRRYTTGLDSGISGKRKARRGRTEKDENFPAVQFKLIP